MLRTLRPPQLGDGGGGTQRSGGESAAEDFSCGGMMMQGDMAHHEAGAPDHCEIVRGWGNAAVSWKHGPFVVRIQAVG